MTIREGFMPFLGHKTYYRIVSPSGAVKASKPPLLLLHGGPGSTHNYFEVLDRLAEEDNRQVIMYDQLGCGGSFVENKPELWTAATWIAELVSLRKHLNLGEVHILGQSWGGMMLLEYVCNDKPEGVKSLILSSTLPASWMWAEEQARRIKLLPQEMQDIIATATAKGKYDDPAFIAAEREFLERHCAGQPSAEDPECLLRPRKIGSESYTTAWGPNEFTAQGTLKDFDVTGQLKQIKEPALIINGGNDLCTPYIAKFMADRIPNSRWELFRDSRHMCFVEATDEYVALLKDWLNSHDR